MFQALGYERIEYFYRGRSLHNESLYGWNGHTKEGRTLGTVEGRECLHHCLVNNNLSICCIDF